MHPPVVMGILNVTPDSFSDGGQYAEGICRQRARGTAHLDRLHQADRHQRGLRHGEVHAPLRVDAIESSMRQEGFFQHLLQGARKWLNWR